MSQTYEEATGTAPSVGHNSGALDLTRALDPEQLLADLQADTTELFKRTEELVAAFGRFNAANKAGIQDETVLSRAGDFVRQLTAHIQAVDARRTTVKAPVLTAQRTIDNFFKRDLTDPVADAKTAVVKAIEDYQRRAREAARAKAAEEAERARQEAARLAAEAERLQSPTLMDAAVEAESRAEVAAAGPAPATVRSDYGTTVSTRQGPWKVRVTDIAKVPAQYLVVNEVVLLATAKTDSRIAAGEQPIPGVEFYRETKANIR